MEKIMDTLAQMVDGKEWNDESDGLFALSGSIDDGQIQAFRSANYEYERLNSDAR